MELPPGVDLVHGIAPDPAPAPRDPLTRAASSVGSPPSTTTGPSASATSTSTSTTGELVLLLGQVGSGKSSLLAALAGLVTSTGEVRWNDTAPSTTTRPILRPAPGRPRGPGAARAVRHLPRQRRPRPRRPRGRPGARRRPGWAATSSDAGGPDALVGHRGVRLSGGQVQRLALARALACDAELLLADDVSSALDATTEVELWAALRERGATVIGATSKRGGAGPGRPGRGAGRGPGRRRSDPGHELAARWGHLAG